MDYVVPYEKGVLVSMNTGSPHVLHGSWWQRFGKVMEQIVNDVDAVQPGASSGGADDGARARLGERRRGAGRPAQCPWCVQGRPDDGEVARRSGRRHPAQRVDQQQLLQQPDVPQVLSIAGRVLAHQDELSHS